tara:strand:- start:598 stop:783 length:186 start_codon:yes stop_codon:yes gene_type:complete
VEPNENPERSRYRFLPVLRTEHDSSFTVKVNRWGEVTGTAIYTFTLVSNAIEYSLEKAMTF